MWDVIAFEGLLGWGGVDMCSQVFWVCMWGLAAQKACPTAAKMLQTPHLLVSSLVQLTEAADDVHEMKWGESFVAEILCQVFLKLYAAAVL